MTHIRNRLVVILVLVMISTSLSAQIKPVTGNRDIESSDLPSTSYIGTDKVSYVRTYDLYAPFSSFPTSSTETTFNSAISAGSIMQSTQYLDGLGRPIETVARRALPGGKDLVQYMVYDEYGRQVYQPMAFQSTGGSGEFYLTPSARLNTFMNGGGNPDEGFYPYEDIFYGKVDYENSPLNRPVKQMAPGNSWAGSNVGVSSSWRTNNANDAVRSWDVGSSGTPTSSAYAIKELMVSITTDEENNKVKQFTDKLGRVILKQVQKGSGAADGHADWLNTYYLYDDYGNLRYVLPPRLVELMQGSWAWNSTDVTHLAFQYTYDERNRMVTKRVPGDGLVEMVYDKLDRLVAIQDGNLRDQDKWMVTKYDALGRPVITGLYSSSASRTSLKTTVESWNNDIFVRAEAPNTINVIEGVNITISQHIAGTEEYRVKNGGTLTFLPGFDSGTDEFITTFAASLSHEYTFYQGYYDASFPTLDSNVEVLTVSYFDDYGFTSEVYDDGQEVDFYPEEDKNAIDPAYYDNVKGMATGSKVKVLGTESDWLTTIMFYDDRGRVIQTVADNHLGGKDVTTTQYDFSGKVLNTYTEHNNPQASGSETQTTIAKRFIYENSGTGRLISIQQKIGSGSYKTLVTNSYDDLGQLATKELGDDVSPLETLNYDYTVRGWLKGINRDYANSGTGSHYFGMDLSYDFGFTQNQLNGNIAGVKWRTVSNGDTRAYGFDYDPSNRLLEADYTQGTSWLQTTNDFSTTYGYDVNGNITNLTRKGVVAGSIQTIDNLTYTYLSSGKSNQLAKVAESNPNGDFGQGDFVDGNTTGDDYAYDENGNMTQDLNKDIASDKISYNHLNLPQTVTFSGNRSITYTYDAAGIKLAKTVNDDGAVTTTDYAAGFIYENNALQHFAHEEGRTRKKGSSFVYDYYVKDHLGNTRMTLTEARDSTVYDATMETEFASFEESVFLNIPGTRDDTYALQGAYSAQVGPESIGPSKMLVVSAGDTVDLSVQALYPSSFGSTGSGEDTDIAMALASVFGVNGGGATVYEQNTYNLLNSEAGGLGGFLASLDDTGTSDVPKAYLNYVLFDQDFEIVESVSSYQKITAASENSFHSIEVSDLIMPEGGFLYVYLSNEGTTSNGGNVYFDVLRINHKKGTVIQEDHYYPFGLGIAALSSTAPLSKPNKFKYNGKEEQTEFDLGWYDYQARNYDPQLGRWFNVDPAADLMRRHSPYNYAFDNPIRFIDPDGMMPTDTDPIKKMRRAFNSFVGSMSRLLSGPENTRQPIPSEIEVDSQTRAVSEIMGVANEVNIASDAGATFAKEFTLEVAKETGDVADKGGEIVSDVGLVASPFTGGASLVLTGVGEIASAGGKTVKTGVHLIRGDNTEAATEASMLLLGGVTNSLSRSAVNKTVKEGIAKAGTKEGDKVINTTRTVLGGLGSAVNKIASWIIDRTTSNNDEEN